MPLRDTSHHWLQCIHSRFNAFLSQFPEQNPLKRLHSIFSVVLFGALSLHAEFVIAGRLFYESDAPEQQRLADADSTTARGVRRARNAKINLATLRTEPDASAQQAESVNAVELNLFGGAHFTAVRTASEKSADGTSESWIGRLEGMSVGQAVLTVTGELVAGTINTDDGRLFEIRPAGKGMHSIREIDPSVFPQDLEPIEAPTPIASDSGESDSPAEFDSGSTIDVMVLYTPAARAAAGGTAAMNTEVDNAIALANTGYQNSGVTQRLRLVYKGEISYTESSPNTLTGYQTDLSRLRATSDGYMDSVHSLRNRYGADFVTLFIKNNAACGLGYLMTTESTGFASSAFNVVDRSCISNFSFAHELGHNMGMQHDRANSSGSGVFSYSFGYGQPGGYRDTMAYQSACGSGSCIRVNYWSSADVTYNGSPLGIAIGNAGTEADGKTTLNNTYDTTRDFRQSMWVTLSSPTGTISDSTPTFTWNAAPGATWYYFWVDDATTTTGKVKTWYSAADAGCGSGTGTCSVTITTNLVDGACRWFVQSYNASGNGPWSAEQAFTVSGGGYSIPGAATLSTPSGTTYTNKPTYTWNAVSTATQYLLQVNTGSTVKVKTWFTKEAAGCAAGTGTCSVTPTIALALGASKWWIQTWNSVGYGPWSSQGDFTVSVPGAVTTLTAPSGNISTSTPTYTWDAVVGATYYYLYVNDSATTGKIKAWYTASEAGCPNGTGACSVTPTTALAAGNGKWWIQTWSPAGYGPWSSEKTFNRQ